MPIFPKVGDVIEDDGLKLKIIDIKGDGKQNSLIELAVIKEDNDDSDKPDEE